MDKRRLKAWSRTQHHHLNVTVQGASPFDLWTAQLDLPTTLEEGRNDVGALYCAPVLPIFSDIAVGSEGEPVPIVEDSLNVRIQIESGPKKYRFLDHARFAVDGNRFVLFGEDPNLREELGESFLLSGSVKYRPWTRQEVLPGAREVVLRFEEGRWLSGSILLDSEQGTSGYSVHFYTLNLDGIEIAQGRADFRADKTFVVYRLPGKRGRFEFQAAGRSEILTSIEGVMPGTRAGPHDPRLLNIDLREKIYTYDLSFVDADGGPVKDLILKSPSLQYPETPYEPGFLVLTTSER